MYIYIQLKVPLSKNKNKLYKGNFEDTFEF